MTQNDRDRQVAPFPTKLVGVAALLTLAVLAWLSWFAYDTYKFFQDTNTRIVDLERARGDIIHLDEVLTMSASMAAATGEVRWRQDTLFDKSPNLLRINGIRSLAGHQPPLVE